MFAVNGRLLVTLEVIGLLEPETIARHCARLADVAGRFSPRLGAPATWPLVLEVLDFQLEPKTYDSYE